ncbi:MAG: flagellar biosynthesis protein FlhF [bacterium]|nr:flagellar biosynthesis protein FlhF [bacterium]
MTINKFQGKTEEEAIERAKKEMGPGVVIMNVKLVKPKGLAGLFKTPHYEVVAAMEEKEQQLNPASAIHAPMRMRESINLAADEQIELPKPQSTSEQPVRQVVRPQKVKEDSRPSATEKKQVLSDTDVIEERLENLQQFLEKKLTTNDTDTGAREALKDIIPNEESPEDSMTFLRMMYRTLLDNEVDEKYVNQLLDDVMKVVRKGSSMDFILSNVYQKLILKFGNPSTIQAMGKKPQVIFFIGPTGVGKTTTIAKIASKFKVEQGKKVAFLTADTYRIAATEQLRTYANILDAPLAIIYAPEEITAAISKFEDYDLIFVDTAGFSHKNELQREDTRKLLSVVGNEYPVTVYLVLSATTKYRDLKEICDMYRNISDYSLIFTKLDETSVYGNLLNIKLYSGADISYVTNGQNVPDDIEVFQTQDIVKKLLGGD